MDFWFSHAQGGTILFLSPPWMIALAAVISLLALVFLRARSGQERRHQAIELLCWIIAFGTLVFAIAQPQLYAEVEKEEKSRMVMVVDSSLSMTIREGGKERSLRAMELLQQLKASIDGPIDLYSFDTQLHQDPKLLLQTLH